MQALLRLSCQSVGRTLELGVHGVTTRDSPMCAAAAPVSLTPAQAMQKAKGLFKSICRDAEQTTAVSAITDAIRGGKEGFFFVHGLAGSGKSTIAKYLTYSTLAAKKQILNVATTGQAALQLPFGVTAHSLCKIPISEEDVLSCTLPLNSTNARSLAVASVLQWDEWPNAKRTAWDSVVDLLERIKTHHAQIWVPKVIVCYGDFRQIPPVLKGASREAIVNNSVRSSATWSLFKAFTLRTNHRQRHDPAYAEWVARLGEGSVPPTHCLGGEPGYIPLDLCKRVHSQVEAIDYCFSALNDPHNCADKKILCPTNAAVDSFNNLVLDKLARVYLLTEYVKDMCSCVQPPPHPLIREKALGWIWQ